MSVIRRTTIGLLRTMLEEGVLAGPGQALPPERELAAWVGVNRLTLRTAMDELIAAGRLRREQGRGAFVAARPRLWPAARLRALRDPAVVLAVDDARGAVGGWAWRVWVAVARRAARAGLRAVAADVATLRAMPAARRVRPIVALGNRLAPEACDALPACAVLGRVSAGVMWNAIDVDWSAAVDEALRRAAMDDERERVLVLFDRRAAALDAQRWFEVVMARLGSRADVIDGGANEGAAYLAARRYLREGGRAARVLADDDLSAAGAQRAWRCAGLDTARLRVVGRGGTRVAQYARPRFATLAPPIDAIADEVMRRVTGGADAREALVMLPAECVWRGRSSDDAGAIPPKLADSHRRAWSAENAGNAV